MSEEIIKVLDELGKRFGVAIDWSNQNIIPYLQELGKRFIAYKTASRILAIIVCTIVMILMFIVIIKLFKWRKTDDFDEYGDDGFLCFMGMLVASITIVILSIVIIGNIEGIMQNLIMPELTIIEYLKGMM